MSNGKPKQENSSPESEATKSLWQVTANERLVDLDASQGFDPYDTASLYIDKLKKQQD